MTESLGYAPAREASAHHEAGHAVASHLLGRSFIKVSLERQADGTLGWIGHRPPGEWFDPEGQIDGRLRRRIEDEIMILLAGPLCEDRYRSELGEDGGAPRAELGDLVVVHGSDVDQALTLAGLASASSGEAWAYLEWLRQRTLSLMRTPGFWPAVEALADEILEHATLDYRRARQVIDRAAGAAQAETPE